MGCGGGGGAAPATSMKRSDAVLSDVKLIQPGTRARCALPATPIQHAGDAPQPAVGAGWPPAHHCHVSQAELPDAQQAAAHAEGEAAPAAEDERPQT